MSSIVKNLCASLETVTLDALVISVVACSDFIKSLLKMNPEERLTAEQALKHKWLTGEVLTFLSISIYLIYVSTYLSIYLSISIYLIYVSTYLSIPICPGCHNFAWRCQQKSRQLSASLASQEGYMSPFDRLSFG